jgi:hypothetical protein
MNLPLDSIKQQWAMPLSGWVLFFWFISSFLFFTFGSSLKFVPNELGKILLTLTSVLTGIAVVVISIRNPTSNKKIAALNPLKKYAWILFSPVVFGLMGAGNVYMVIFAMHSTMAEAKSIVLVVSYKGKDLDFPGRCKQYVYFKATAPFIRKTCVSIGEFERLERDTTIIFPTLQSPLGFQLTSSAGAIEASTEELNQR